jgi:type I restriction enzyme S subunit
VSFRAYPKYKESGVDWIGRVPNHWDVKRLGFYFTERREKVSDREYQPLSVTKRGIVPQLETAAKSDDGDNRKRVEKGDFVINSRSDRKGSSGISDFQGSVSLICTVLQMQENLSQRFIHHLLRSEPFQEEFYRNGKGIVADLWSTNYSEMRNIQLPMPPLNEQLVVSAFLDRETARLDALIAEQVRLIELLGESRRALICHAITKGLHSHVPMKDSGIEWLGKVPAHWRIAKCGFYISILSGFPFPSDGFTDDASDAKLLRGINVGVGCLRWDEAVYWRRTENDGLDEYELDDGDLVIGMDRPLINEGMRVAKVVASDVPCLLLQRVAKLKPGSELDRDYLFQLLSSEMFVAHFAPETTGVSVPHISPEQIHNIVIPIPPLEEQRAIARFVHTEAAKLDSLAAEADDAIALLQERRAALIAEVVTGKIDLSQLKGPSIAASGVKHVGG